MKKDAISINRSPSNTLWFPEKEFANAIRTFLDDKTAISITIKDVTIQRREYHYTGSLETYLVENPPKNIAPEKTLIVGITKHQIEIGLRNFANNNEIQMLIIYPETFKEEDGVIYLWKKPGEEIGTSGKNLFMPPINSW